MLHFENTQYIGIDLLCNNIGLKWRTIKARMFKNQHGKKKSTPMLLFYK